MPAIQYTFEVGQLKHSTYADGTTVPHLEMRVMRGGVDWGYIEVHLHKVNIDRNEIDISAGITVRINPEIQTV